jgi:EpsI family protein
MIGRRDLLIAGACVAAAGTAFGLRPRRRVSLQGAAKLDDIMPRRVGDWDSRDVSDLIAPQSSDSLMAKLYSETVGRVYTQRSTEAEIMMLLAHGDTQSNDLQLHRPEVCYPAFGFAISDSSAIDLPLGAGVGLPARQLVATAPGRKENIVYWSRLGEYMPIDGAQQRLDRLKTSMDGFVADGLLARFSMLGLDSAQSFATLVGFIRALVHAVPAAQRVALVGTPRAAKLAAQSA